MKTKRIIAGLGLGAAVVILLTGCFGAPTPSTNNVTGKPAASQSAAPNTGNGNNGSTSASPQPTATYSSPADPNSAAGVIPFAETIFPKAKATGSYSKDQVLSGLYTAYMYAKQAQNDSYFISGDWAKAGYPQEVLTTNYRNFYTDSAMQQLLSYVASMKNDTSSAQLVFSAINFLPESKGNYTVCTIKSVTCQEPGYPKLTSDVQYQQLDNGELQVVFTMESRITMTLQDGTKGYLPVINKMSMFLKKNDSYKGDAGTYPFLIDGWNNDISRPGFTS